MSSLRSLCLLGLVSVGGVACSRGAEEPAPASDASPLPSYPGSRQPSAPTTPAPEPQDDDDVNSHDDEDPPVAEQPPPEPESPPPPAYVREWYVSPSGDDSASGSRDRPLRTISKALTLVGPGEIIRVQKGTYAEKLVIGASTRAGTADAPITLLGEGLPKVVPTSGGWFMAHVQRPHWRIEGFEFDVQGQRQVAVTFSGNTEGTVLAGNELHHGAFGSGISTDAGAKGITIEGNHIHHFARGNDDSHGVVIAPTSVNITVRGNDIHDNSGDSVQCLGPEGFSDNTPARGVLIEDNEMYDNRENAVDLKTCHDVVVRGNRMYGFTRSTSSRGEAVVVHYSAKNVVIEENDIFDASIGIAVGGNRVGAPPTNVSIRRNRIHDLKTPEGSGIRIENGHDVRVLHNTVVGTDGFAFVVGHGTGGASTHVAVRNNVFATRNAVSMGLSAPGLRMESNLYLTGAAFNSGIFVAPQSDWVGGTLANWLSDGVELGSGESGEPLVDLDALLPGEAAVDRGMDLGLPYCGAAPDIGAVESDCPEAATAELTE
ncbi:right-handed parallel beta-helix repeat-containing protein [Myxococcus sp. Y35]|uniref:right-handed parallel beta-helix repeat-containing protein n=1 Tax=Pseudomyxococcus flavus TaxID=3115648 RepID=UPI003CF1FA03